MQASQKKQKGAAAVEFALVLPALLMIVFGIVEFGILLYDKAVITNASREAARAGIVLKNPKPNVQDITDAATKYAKNYLLTFGTRIDPVVAVGGNGGSFGQPLSVTVSYRYTGLALGKLFNAFTNNAITLSATTTMNHE